MYVYINIYIYMNPVPGLPPPMVWSLPGWGGLAHIIHMTIWLYISRLEYILYVYVRIIRMFYTIKKYFDETNVVRLLFPVGKSRSFSIIVKNITEVRTILSNPLKFAAVLRSEKLWEVVCCKMFLQDFALCPSLIFPRTGGFQQIHHIE